MSFVHCRDCYFAEQVNDDLYYCTFWDTLEDFGCSRGERGGPRPASPKAERAYERYLKEPLREEKVIDRESIIQKVRDMIYKKGGKQDA